MSLISKNTVQAAFDKAEPDILADYGLEYGTEWGFSRGAVNRILTSAFAVEKHFEPGQLVWIVERDEDGEVFDVARYVFLAEVAGYAILSPYANYHDYLEYLLNYHRRETNTDYDEDLTVVRITDCFASQKAAHVAHDKWGIEG